MSQTYLPPVAFIGKMGTGKSECCNAVASKCGGYDPFASQFRRSA